ncbi:hypothetical protein BD626DRAFT_499977 [Schizophyllum amplum]|uniref:PWI domain-containing protein n=1 Tax=Schizophyllum amplum TaxID=97359 RepID=A0A550CBE7_9AGAR|nr:hypothetical protein BD626DRAFT_499977 [Auriculariopsis ampla]
MGFMPPSPQRSVSLFVGSISGGIDDDFLNRLLSACGPVRSFKRLITPANKPQGFGFAEYEDLDSAIRAIDMLTGIELPALEDMCANKKLLVKADEKTKTMLDAHKSSRISTDQEEERTKDAKARIDELVTEINNVSQKAIDEGRLEKEKGDLPENQRGLVISEIAQFRERAAKREREKMRDMKPAAPAPSGPKVREWGKPQNTQASPPLPGNGAQRGFGNGAQGYQKPVPFVKAESETRDDRALPGKSNKTDLQLEEERQEARRRDEEASFRDRERRYEPRERNKMTALERGIARERATRDAEERDRKEIRMRLDIWDDDESDELFYMDRARWRHARARRLEAEEAADAKSRAYEEEEAENLRRESEDFLARQMDEMQALAEEQRKAGLLLDDGAPVRLNVALPAGGQHKEGPKEKATVFGQEEEEEEAAKRRKVPLVKLDFSVTETTEKAQERLEKIRTEVPTDKDTLFKRKVRWDGVTETMIDRKMEPLIKRLMIKYLGEMEEEDLIMFVLEHLKDHKAPKQLIEGLEPVLEEEAIELTVSVWRQLIFESMAYSDGLLTGDMYVDAE